MARSCTPISRRGSIESPPQAVRPERLTEPDFASGGYAHVWPSHLANGRDSSCSRYGAATHPHSTALCWISSHDEWQLERANVQAALPLASGHLVFNDRDRSMSLLASRLDAADGDAFPVIEEIVLGTFTRDGTSPPFPRLARSFMPPRCWEDAALTVAPPGWGIDVNTATTSRGFTILACPRTVTASYVPRREELHLAPRSFVPGRPTCLDLSALMVGNWNPTWSPDGMSIAFGSSRESARLGSLRGKSLEVSPPRFWSRSTTRDQASWSPDGSVLVFVEFHPVDRLGPLDVPPGPRARTANRDACS